VLPPGGRHRPQSRTWRALYCVTPGTGPVSGRNRSRLAQYLSSRQETYGLNAHQAPEHDAEMSASPANIAAIPRTPRRDLLTDLARELRVTLGDLLGEPVLAEDVDNHQDDNVPAVRDALMAPRRLSRVLYATTACRRRRRLCGRSSTSRPRGVTTRRLATGPNGHRRGMSEGTLVSSQHWLTGAWFAALLPVAVGSETPRLARCSNLSTAVPSNVYIAILTHSSGLATCRTERLSGGIRGKYSCA